MNQKIKELRNDIKRLEDKVENKDRDFIIFSVLVPIIVAGIAAIASLYQIRINIIKSNQVRWVNELRACISDYLAEIQYIYTIISNIVDDIKDGESESEVLKTEYHKIIESSKKANKLSFAINLYLEPTTRHGQLKTAIENIENRSINKFSESELHELDKLIKAFISIAKELFFEEFKKAKKLSLFRV